MKTWINSALAFLLAAAAVETGAAIIGEAPIAPLGTISGIDSGVAVGPDGTAWFTGSATDKIGSITASGSVTPFALPPGDLTGGITVGADGNVWAGRSGKVARITPAGTVTEFPVSVSVRRITAGPDGNLWFTGGGNTIGRITPAGAVNYFSLPNSNSAPVGITAGPDGNLWFVEIAANLIGRITPAGVITEFPVLTPVAPGFSQLFSITAGPDGNLWFTEGGRIGRITPAGVVTEFPNPSSGSNAIGIATGSDGNLWFTDNANSRIGRVTPDGTFLPDLTIPSAVSAPQLMAAGPDGLIWFTEGNTNRIGFAFATGSIATFFPLSFGASWTYLQNGTTSVTSNVTGTALVNEVTTTVVHSTDGGGNDVYWTSDGNGIRDHKEVYSANDIVTLSPPLNVASSQPVFGTTAYSFGMASGLSSGFPFSLSYTFAVTLGGVETVSVPAGTFKAIKSQSTLSLNGVPGSSTQVNWVAANVGPVKNISDGGDTYELTSTSLGVTAPDVFSYVSPPAAPSVTANTFTVTGITVPSPVSISGGQYSINGGAYTGALGSVHNSDSVTVLPMARINPYQKQAVVTIGGIPGVFNLTSRESSRSDFDGDGKSDILWRNTAGDDAVWLMSGLTRASGALITTVTDPNWQIQGTGDFDGDGKADILWRNVVTGDNAIWLMNGASVKSPALILGVADTAWTIAGVADFDGDGKADILWKNTATGDTAVWLMNGFTLASSALVRAVTDANWKLQGVWDFDGDGKADVLWRNEVTGDNAIWLMDGVSVKSAALILGVTDANWKIQGAGDFDGDGKADILWRNTATGDVALWLMNGLGIKPQGAALIASVPVEWSIAGVGDFDGDGKADILWRNVATGDNAIWLMNGFTIGSTGLILSVTDLAWAIVGK